MERRWPTWRLSLNDLETRSDSSGEFFFELSTSFTAEDILEIHADELNVADKKYPFMPKPLKLFLGEEVFAGHNNVILRPIYIPVLDTANERFVDATLDPDSVITLTSTALPGAEITFRSGDVVNKTGEPFQGMLGITEVPLDLTPADLPPEFYPEMVITVQPTTAVFMQPARVKLPNRLGHNPLTLFDLYEVDPQTGEFHSVALMQVSPDGTHLRTVVGGIQNGSWLVPIPQAQSAEDLTPQPQCACPNLEAFNSEVDLFSGAMVERLRLPTYQSQGTSRGVELVYDSARANPTTQLRFRNELRSNMVHISEVGQRETRVFAKATVYADGMRTTAHGIGAESGSSNAIRWRRTVLCTAPRLRIGGCSGRWFFGGCWCVRFRVAGVRTHGRRRAL